MTTTETKLYYGTVTSKVRYSNNAFLWNVSDGKEIRRYLWIDNLSVGYDGLSGQYVTSGAQIEFELKEIPWSNGSTINRIKNVKLMKSR